MRARLGGAIAVAAMVAACSGNPDLVPAPGAQPAAGSGGAMAEVAGVKMSAWPDRWQGNPAELENEVTPVLVRVENQGSEAVTIRYQNFEFLNPAGTNFEAIPPYNISESVVEPVEVTAFPFSRFQVAPHLRRYYSRLRAWNDPFLFDRAWFGRRFTVWQRVQLPTGDMIRGALPEGVLEPGGIAEGFVYFEHVSEQAEQITLTMNLVTPSGKTLGKVEIPFMVD
jgi:hypothetical protein